MEREIFGYHLKGTDKQLDEMYDLLNREDYTSSKFQHYFYVWVHEGTGVYWFPKERYFVSFRGERHYPIALFYYGIPLTRLGIDIHKSDYERNY